MTTATALKTSFETVLVATDFGEQADRALAYAKAIVRNAQGELLLAHVSQPVIPTYIPEGGWIDDATDVERDEINLEAAAVALRAEGIRANSACGYGGVADELARQVKNSQADLVVVGTHGRRGLARLFAGSHAESIASSVTVPVMIVGPKCAIRLEPEWKPKQILCNVHLDDDGVEVAAYASRLAQACGASVAVAYDEARRTHERGEVMSAMLRIYEDWNSFKVAVHAHVSLQGGSMPALHGMVLEQKGTGSLVDLAISRDVDLLMVGVRHKLIDWPSLGRGALPRLLAEAPCPVMTIPREKK